MKADNSEVQSADCASSDAILQFRDWSEIAKAYLLSCPKAHAWFRIAELEPFGGLRVNRPVIEVGCGRGEFAEAATSDTIEYGVDLSHRSVVVAQQSGRFHDVRCADANKLPFDDGSIGTVLSISVLEHVGDPVKAIQESFRVLRPGGEMVATLVTSDLHQLSWLGPVTDKLFHHVSLFTIKSWIEIFEDAGFTVTEYKSTVGKGIVSAWERGFATAWPYRISRRLSRDLAVRFGNRWEDEFRKLQDVVRRNGTDGGGACLFIRARKVKA